MSRTLKNVTEFDDKSDEARRRITVPSRNRRSLPYSGSQLTVLSECRDKSTRFVAPIYRTSNHHHMGARRCIYLPLSYSGGYNNTYFTYSITV